MDRTPISNKVKKSINISVVLLILIIATFIIIPDIVFLQIEQIAHRSLFFTLMMLDVISVLGVGTIAIISARCLLALYEELHEAFVRIRKSEMSKSGIMTSAQDGILSVNRDGVILECNPAAERLFGFKNWNAQGSPLSSLFKGFSDADGLLLNSQWNATEREPIELTAIRKDGLEFPVEVTSTQVNTDEFTFFSLFVRDISKRKRDDEEKNKAIRARDELIGVVSHELKNPMEAINSSLILLRKTVSSVGGASSSPEKSYIENIASSLKRMSRLVSDLLDATCIEAGKLNLDLKNVDISDLLNELVDVFQAQAEARNLKFMRNIPATPFHVVCDRSRVFQVLSNLIGNAIKFSSEGGWIQMRAEPNENQVLFQVKDAGPGISEANLPNIFDRFWQAKQFAYRGVGLGLSIAKGIIEAHGGKIWAESKIGEGSTFYFTLPARGPELKQRMNP